MTQRERVLTALRRGPVNTTDFTRTPTIDGGPPILRLAARIRELRQDAKSIVSRRRANGTVDYALGNYTEAEHDWGAEQDGATTATEPPMGASPMSAVPLSVMEDARGREVDPPSGPTLFDVPRVSGGYRDTEQAA